MMNPFHEVLDDQFCSWCGLPLERRRSVIGREYLPEVRHEHIELGPWELHCVSCGVQERLGEL